MTDLLAELRLLRSQIATARSAFELVIYYSGQIKSQHTQVPALLTAGFVPLKARLARLGGEESLPSHLRESIKIASELWPTTGTKTKDLMALSATLAAIVPSLDEELAGEQEVLSRVTDCIRPPKANHRCGRRF